MRGERIILRGKRTGDVADDYAWRSDQELSRLDATRPLQMSFFDYARYSHDQMVAPNELVRRFSIDTLDGKHIGNCVYYDINFELGEAELGIMIGDRRYWGKGYGVESVSRLLDHIFTATPLTRIYLHTLEWNQRARRAFEKCGFIEVGRVWRDGYDFVLMEMLRSDWERDRRAAGPPLESAAAPPVGEPGED